MKYIYFILISCFLFTSLKAMDPSEGEEQKESLSAQGGVVRFDDMWENLKEKKYDEVFSQSKRLVHQGSYEAALILGVLTNEGDIRKKRFVMAPSDELPAPYVWAATQEDKEARALVKIAFHLLSQNLVQQFKSELRFLHFWEDVNELFCSSSSWSKGKMKDFYGLWGLKPQKKLKGIGAYREIDRYLKGKEAYVASYDESALIQANFPGKKFDFFKRQDEDIKKKFLKNLINKCPGSEVSEKQYEAALTLYSNYFGIDYTDDKLWEHMTSFFMGKFSYIPLCMYFKKQDNHIINDDVIAEAMIHGGHIDLALLQASEAFENKDYGKAVSYYQLAADQGHAEAQHNLGVSYINGLGVGQNYEKAVFYFEKAAAQGNVDGQVNLGMCYYKGCGVEQSYEDAFKYFTLAVAQGNVDGQVNVNLGLCYYNGQGVEQSYEDAFKYFTLAADQGDADGQANLGLCYYHGQGVERRYEDAFKYFTLAADQGDALSQNNLGVLYATGRSGEKDYGKAFYYYGLAAKQGYAAAQNNLGSLYYTGDGVEKNYKEAFKYLKLAADQGFVNAKIGLKILEEEVGENLSKQEGARASDEEIHIVDSFKREEGDETDIGRTLSSEDIEEFEDVSEESSSDKETEMSSGSDEEEEKDQDICAVATEEAGKERLSKAERKEQKKKRAADRHRKRAAEASEEKKYDARSDLYVIRAAALNVLEGVGGSIKILPCGGRILRPFPFLEASLKEGMRQRVLRLKTF